MNDPVTERELHEYKEFIQRCVALIGHLKGGHYINEFGDSILASAEYTEMVEALDGYCQSGERGDLSCRMTAFGAP